MGKKLSVAIVGAGIGGLALAAFLRKLGMEARIYEQASQFARVGAGIQMTPNAMKVLRGLGVEERLCEVAYQPPFARSREWDTGRVTSEMPVKGAMLAQFGAPFLFLHRADLHAALESQVPRECVDLNRKLVGISQSGNGVTLSFADGTRVTADAVIGADGVHSTVREALLGPENPRFTGRVAYRTTFPAALMGENRITPARTKWWGPDRHMVVYYVNRREDEVYFTTSTPEEADWRTRESWSSEGDLAVLREAYRGFHPEVQNLLAAAPKVHKWALMARDPLPRWGEGNITLLGDACHPMTPYMAQGAASALEDAAVLSRCLKGADRDGVAEAFARYEAIRRPRATSIQSQSGKNTWLKESAEPAWVYSYDAWTMPLAAPEPTFLAPA